MPKSDADYVAALYLTDRHIEPPALAALSDAATGAKKAPAYRIDDGTRGRLADTVRSSPVIAAMRRALHRLEAGESGGASMKSQLVRWWRRAEQAVNPLEASVKGLVDARLAVMASVMSDDESDADQLAAIHPDMRAKVADRSACDAMPHAAGEFGRAWTNPIPANGARGEVKYLNRLLCASCIRERITAQCHTRGAGNPARLEMRAPIVGHRLVSYRPPGVADPVDLYEVMCASGRHWDLLFFDMYFPRRSRQVPAGFLRQSFDTTRDLLVGLTFNEYCEAFPQGLRILARRAYDEDTAQLLLAVLGEQGGSDFSRPADHADCAVLALVQAGAFDDPIGLLFPVPLTQERMNAVSESLLPGSPGGVRTREYVRRLVGQGFPLGS